MKKLCFVIMGFGQKKDPDTNRTIDLDETYKKIIQPAVLESGYNCIRADEILESGIIDRSMYALLYKAELVIADISTYNPNAMYELGARHVLKRFSTIIIKEDESKIPFDINHSRTLSYKHLGNEISALEAKKSIRELKDLINTITKTKIPIVDSPLYSFIPKIKEPTIQEEELDEIIGELKENENTIYYLTEKAKGFMKDNKFLLAAETWKKLIEKTNNEIYYIQQEALCTYKSELPNKIMALTNALQIISKLSEYNDTETLGISGAINKNLWKCTKELSYLVEAKEKYKRGWNLFKDYYTGENYAHCLEQLSLSENDTKAKNYYEFEAYQTRIEIIDLVLKSIESDDPDELKWKYATLSNCFLAIGNITKANEYEISFKAQNPVGWEIETFETSKNEIFNLKKENE